MNSIIRISADETRQKSESGAALLVGTSIIFYYYDGSYQTITTYDCSGFDSDLKEILLTLNDNQSNGGSCTVDNFIFTPAFPEKKIHRQND